MRRVVVAMAIFACCGMAEAQMPSGTELGSRVDALAQKMLSRPVAGISVAVARDGRAAFARGYGMANLGKNSWPWQEPLTLTKVRWNSSCATASSITGTCHRVRRVFC